MFQGHSGGSRIGTALGAIILTALTGLCATAAASPIVINNVSDLENINSNLSGDYVLGSDINATGFPFTPIGTTLSPFAGIFDGQGHTINGLSINASSFSLSSPIEIGLFGSIGASGVARNVGLNNVAISVNAPSSAVGGLAGDSLGTLSNVYVNGSITVTGALPGPGGTAIGGLVGDTGGLVSKISQASAATNISTSSGVYSAIGGLVGLAEGQITLSHSSGTIVSSGFEFYGVGGLVGESNNANISQSSSSGLVAGGSLYHGVGDLLGLMSGLFLM